MDVDVLGPLRLDAGRVRIAPRDRIVLTALAVGVGRALTVDELTDVLWHDHPPVSAPKVVQGCVARLRKALGPSAVETTSAGYRLTGDGVRLDTAVFVSLLTQSREHRVAGDLERAAGLLASALRLWRGRPFVEITDWAPAEAEAARLTELRLVAEEDLVELRLDLGDHVAVAADALTLSAAEPWRERRWVLLALAQYRCGRQTDALATIRRAAQALRTELGVDPGPELASLETSVLNQDPSLLVPAALQGPYDDSCPYKGLAAYGVADASLFFGRSSLVVDLAARLEDVPLLVVAGDSGAGKSSVIRAGLIPSLQEGGREAVILVPTADPQTAVAAALGAATGDDPVVVIDQFEEIFTQGADIRAWLSWVVEYATTRAPIVLAIRADHVGGLAQNPDLARLVEKGMHLVRPLAGDELREAIEGPARAAGLDLEHGLVDLIVRDVEGGPGGQPLMSHALMETWHRRTGRTMTVEGYRASGGIRGAVTRSAERLYRGLDEDDRDAVRSIMLRLCPVDDDGRPERARVPLSVFIDDPRSMRMIETLVRARLVTATEGQVEVAHEALARTWPRFRRWLGDDAAGRRIFKHLVDAAQGWDSLGRPESELYRGGRLEIAMDWRAAGTERLSAVEAAFLEASALAAQRDRDDLSARAAEQARQNRRLRALLTGVAGLLVISLLTGIFAVANSRRAQSQREAAQAAEGISRHTSLVSRSTALRSTNRGLAALLAVEAYRDRPDGSAYSALLGTFTGSPGFMGYTHLGKGITGNSLNGVMVPGTSIAVVADGGRDLRRVNLSTGEVKTWFDPAETSEGSYSDLRVSADGRYLAKLAAYRGHPWCFSAESLEHHDGAGCASLSVFSMATGKRVLGPLHTPFSGGDVAVSADGTYVAITGGYAGQVALYRVADGKHLATAREVTRPDGLPNVRDTGSVLFDGDRLYAGSLAGQIREFAVPSMRQTGTIKAPTASSSNSMQMLGDGTLITTGDRWVLSINSHERTINWRADVTNQIDGCPFRVAAEKIGRFYCGSYYGGIQERGLDTGQPTGRSLDPQIGSVGDLSLTADGTELVAFAAQRSVITRWRLDGTGPIARLEAAGRIALAPAGDDGLFPVARTDGFGGLIPPVQLWDSSANNVSRTIVGATAAIHLGASLLALENPSGIYTVEGADDPTAAAKALANMDQWASSKDGKRLFISSPGEPQGPAAISRLDTPAFRTRWTIRTPKTWGTLAMSVSADGQRLYVALEGTDAEPTTRVHVYDTADGHQITSGMPDYPLTVVTPANELVAATESGELTVHDPVSFAVTATLPGARGEVSTIQPARDGRLLAVTSGDQTIQLYDLATRIRLADPIESTAGSNDGGSGWLSADGKRLTVNTDRGVAVWDLRATDMLTAACQVAGRNLTKNEWRTHLGKQPYRKTCEPFSAG